jgi:predicted acylesterase/phospholipase RssA
MEGKNLGLGLSGGGYRATLFNLGALIRLNEFGLMGKIKRITSVSGGSITNGCLAMRWNDLQFNDDGVIERFKENIVEPLWDFCSKSLDAGAIIWGTLDPFHRVSDKITAAYNKVLFKHFKMASGTYWGITTKIDNYGLPDALVKDNEVTRGLREIKTRLTSFSDADKGKLINWGYALADAGMRKHVKEILVKIPEPQWPFPEYDLN